ncbi:MAG: hypothetical protein SGCHY_005432, partial [Lobulomycetales sp.]
MKQAIFTKFNDALRNNNACIRPLNTLDNQNTYLDENLYHEIDAQEYARNFKSIRETLHPKQTIRDLLKNQPNGSRSSTRAANASRKPQSYVTVVGSTLRSVHAKLLQNATPNQLAPN